VESSGSKSLVNLGQSTYTFYVRFNHFLPTFRGAVKVPVQRVCDPGHGYLRRVRACVGLGLGKRWHAAREIHSLRRPWY
jgi:hypothetical protein